MHQQVSEFLEYLVTKHGRSANTIAAYRNDLTQLVEYLESQATATGHTWADVTFAVLQDYLHFLHHHQVEYSSATVARKVAAVKSFCEYLHSTGWIAEDFAKGLQLPKVTKNLPHALRAEEIVKLLAAPDRQRTPQSLRDKALLETLYASGMRVTELVALDLGDVDLAGRVIRCGAASKRNRKVGIDEQAVNALAHYLQEGRDSLLVDRHEQALFLNHRGQRLTRQGLWLIIRRYVKQVGIKMSVTPHTLRNSFAAHLLNSGVALREVQERLGYATLTSAQVYQQVANGVASELEIDGKPVLSVNSNQ